MSKCIISFGNYNKSYKYIWIYLILTTINEFLYGGRNYLSSYTSISIPKSIFANETIHHSFLFIVSLAHFFYNISRLSNTEGESQAIAEEKLYNDLLYQKKERVNGFFHDLDKKLLLLIFNIDNLGNI